MAGTIFKQEVMKATERSWEEWIVALGQEVGPLWSHEQIRNHIVGGIRYPGNGASGSPSCMSRSWGGCPSAYPKMPGCRSGSERRWPRQREGLGFPHVFRGTVIMDRGCSFSEPQVGHEYESKEGVSGKITVVVPYHKRA